MTDASLVVGPLLRFVDDSRATIWVETDRPTVVEVLGHRAPTWTVHGHHYALVVITGLPPGTATPYTVDLDGRQVWPDPVSTFPPSVLRTRGAKEEFRLAFGSCRRAEPFDADALSRFGADALVALAERMRERPLSEWPDALLLAGDQIYADTPSEAMTRRVRAAHAGGPAELAEVRDEIADFEEYTWLYAESWTPEPIRWLLSTVPTCMLLDDHDLRDDWNTSQAWREWITTRPWWRDRVQGALASYWIYQHLGNLSPDDLAADEIWAMVCSEVSDDERSRRLDEFAWRSDVHPDTTRWSYDRDFDAAGTRIRLVAIDTRCSRQLDPAHRGIVDAAESAWLTAAATAPGIDHLLVATPLPVFVSHGIHHLESWNEAVAGGAYGTTWGTRFGEWVRREVDLEHWSAFRHSFDLFVSVLGELSAAISPPASVLILSGDVHCSY
ncbi:MAG: alkaline phosphatase D family protein, partial [Gordonia sp. (in: high G+C Gram-positive bacteria)]